MKTAARILCLVMALAVSGCAGEQYGGVRFEGVQFGQNQTSALIGGAVLGGFAGSLIGGGTGQVVAAGIGTLMGALLGSEIGKSLDRSDELNSDESHGPQAAGQAH